MSELLRDLRQGLRAVARRPGVAAVAVVTLALGIGANAAIFTVVNAVLLRPLPYREADRLVAAFAHDTRRGETRNPTSPADFLEWGRGSGALDRLTAAHPWSPVLTGRGRPEELPALNASPSLFDLLGVEPALGRVFHSASEEPQVVLSYGLWQRRFGADPGLIGQALVLDGKSYAVAGVMPPGFRFPPFWATAAELWAPLVFTAEAEASHGRFLRVFGRLRPGATLEQARAELGVVGRRLEVERPESNAGIAVNVEALQEPVVSRVRPALLVLAGSVAFVLLVACANVTSLLLAQGLSRGKEVAIRAALGASRSRLVRQWLAESLVLAGSLGLSRVLAGLLHGVSPTDPLTFAAVTLLLTAVAALACFLPARRAARVDPLVALRES